MSQILAPIHEIMYKKIHRQGGWADTLVRTYGDEAMAQRLDREAALAQGPLAEVIDHNDIHGWLSREVAQAEKRFAMAVAALLAAGVSEKAMAVTMYDLGWQEEGPEAERPMEAFYALNWTILDGMPCDGALRFLWDDATEARFLFQTDTHKPYWDALGLERNLYRRLRRAYLQGWLAASPYRWVNRPHKEMALVHAPRQYGKRFGGRGPLTRLGYVEVDGLKESAGTTLDWPAAPGKDRYLIAVAGQAELRLAGGQSLVVPAGSIGAVAGEAALSVITAEGVVGFLVTLARGAASVPATLALYREGELLLEGPTLRIVHRSASEGGIIPRHAHPGDTVFFLPTQGSAHLTLGDTQEIDAFPGTFVRFDGRHTIEATAAEPLEAMVFLVRQPQA